MAGMVGFEPTVHCTKNSCLTTWLHPSACEGRSNACSEGVQEVFCKKCEIRSNQARVGKIYIIH